MKKTKEWIKIVIQLCLIASVIFFAFHFLILAVQVEGDSMYPFLEDGNIAIMSARQLDKNHIQRFDVVVLQSDVLDKKIIKRVIGLPGETVSYKDDCLYIDDQYIEETFLDQDYIQQVKEEYHLSLFTDNFTITLEDDELFVLGDNRIKSADSRTIGAFHYDDVLGKEGVILFPFKDMKLMNEK